MARASLGVGECLSLSGTAAGMWRAIVAHGNRRGVVAALLREYEVDEATLRADLEQFIQELAARGALVDGESG